MSQSQPLPSAEVLRHLQEMFLKAAITKQPLPHSSRVLDFPDLSYILRHSDIYLSNENLSEPINVEGLPKPLRILSPEELAEEGRKHGDLAYLRFQPPKPEGDGVRLVLEGRLVPGDPQQRALGLSAVQLKFRELDGQWKADDPIMMAM